MLFIEKKLTGSYWGFKGSYSLVCCIIWQGPNLQDQKWYYWDDKDNNNKEHFINAKAFGIFSIKAQL